MRLRQITVDGFKAIRRFDLQLGQLVILFGANSSGKTNVLDAINYLLSGAESGREDQRDEYRHEMPEASVLLVLDGAGEAGHPDRVLLDELFMAKYEAGHSYGIMNGDERADLTAGLSPAEVRDLLATELAAGAPGESDDRQLVARELMESTVLVMDQSDTWLLAHPDALSAQGNLAVERIKEAAQDDTDDQLADICRTLASDMSCEVESLSAGLAVRPFPMITPVELRTEPDGISAEVITALQTADVALDWLMSPGSSGVRFSAAREDNWLEAMEHPVESLGASASSQTPKRNPVIITVSSLETDDEEDEWGARALPSVGNVKTWYRTRPVMTALASMLASRATELLPDFVRSNGAVEIEVLPPTTWTRDLGRVRVGFRHPGAAARSLRSLGAGTRRWVAAATRLACADLTAAAWELQDGTPITMVSNATSGSKTSLDDGTWARLGAAAEDGSLSDLVHPIWPERLGDLFLVDEPEANLHADAVRSVVDWLSRLQARTNGVLVATHHPAFLSLGADEASLIHVQRTGDKTTLSPIPSSDLALLDEIGGSVGLTRAEMLQHTRLVLFVEGPHDEILLNAFVGDVLSAARVRIIPMHGTRNALALVDSELIGRLGIPIGVLTDNARGSDTSPEDRAVDRLIQEAELVNRTIHRFGIYKRDILDYLHVDACRESAPTFPGWDLAADEWKAKGRPGRLKEFVRDEYGLRLDRRSVTWLADRTMALHGPPAAIVRTAKEIAARASELASNAVSPEID